MVSFSKFVDRFYQTSKEPVFKMTGRSPENAHALLIQFLRSIYHLKAHKWFERSFSKEFSELQISNAAGLNKNGEIPPCLLRLLGFDRAVIGTVSKEPWKGNKKPRVLRFRETQSMVNWLGLPGNGARTVRNFLRSYSKDNNLPGTLNIAPTPKSGMTLREKIDDLKFTLDCMKEIEWIDRIELNISCPNIINQNSLNEQQFFDGELTPYLEELSPILESTGRKLYLKISPDTDEIAIQALLKTIENFPIEGITACNSTKRHDPNWIAQSPGIGGASGEAVYSYSREVQEFLLKYRKKELEIVACGGINTQGKAKFLRSQGICELQIYTPLIYQGFSILNRLRI